MSQQELKLEVGKTYVFRDETCKRRYLGFYSLWVSHLIKLFYKDGFTIGAVAQDGSGCIEDKVVITPREIKYFKLKDDQPEDVLTQTADTPTTEDFTLNKSVIDTVEELDLLLIATKDRTAITYNNDCYIIKNQRDFDLFVESTKTLNKFKGV